MQIERTPERLERGKYLAWHVFQCMECHSQRDFSLFAAPPIAGTEGAGGDKFTREMGFPGTFVARNITPYGIGDWTDGELFIEADHPESEVDAPFNLILRTIPQEANLGPIPPKSDELAYGEYMFTAASCGECHTKFENGEFTGPLCAGGREFEFPGGAVLCSPNITPHETGIKSWTKEVFIAKFKQYQDSSYVPAPVEMGKDFQTIMPWMTYSGMTEDDLGAIFTYLQSLEPVDNAVEKFVPASE